MRLQNKIAIVTGAAGGMGESSALLFAREGAKVALVDLREDAVQPHVEQIRGSGGQAIAIGADITRTEDVKRIAERTHRELGLPNVLFNNAGVDTEDRLPLIEISEQAFDRAVEVNLKGTWLMMKYIVPLMIQAGGGSIVNTASIGAHIVCATAGYSAAKAGVLALTRVGAVELARFRIRVNSLLPGATMSPMARELTKVMEARGIPTASQMIGRMGLMGRMAEPVEMANMALFLASDEASFTTGAEFVNDGGWMAMSGIESKSAQ